MSEYVEPSVAEIIEDEAYTYEAQSDTPPYDLRHDPAFDQGFVAGMRRAADIARENQ